MQLNIQKWGNSAAVRLPSAMLAQLGAKVGDAFEVDVTSHAAVLRVAKPHYTLAELLAQCDLHAPAPAMDDWEQMPPAGQEVW